MPKPSSLSGCKRGADTLTSFQLKPKGGIDDVKKKIQARLKASGTVPEQYTGSKGAESTHSRVSALENYLNR